MRLAVGRRELGPVHHPVADVKLLLGHVDIRQLLQPGHDFRNRFADLPVFLESLEGDRRAGQHLLRQVAQDHRFRPHIVQPPDAAVRQPDVVEHRLLRRRRPFLVPRRDRHDQALALPQPVHMAAVERGGEEQLEADGAQRARGERGVRRRAPEVAAHNHRRVDLAALRRLHPGHGVEAFGPRQGNAESLLHSREHRLGDHRLHPDGADPLHVGMPAQRQEPGIAPADHAPQQRQTGDGLDIVDAVQVVGHPHAPGEDDVLPRGKAGGDALDIGSRDAANPGDLFPGERLEVGLEGLDPGGMAAEERPVFRPHRQHRLCQPLEQRDVGADPRLRVVRGDLGAACQHRARALGHGEPDQPRLLGRVDDDHVAAAVAAMLEHVDEAGMVRRRIGADDEDQVGAGQVLELDGRCARADGRR